MKRKLQLMIQMALLVLFIFLFVADKMQLWMGIFILGVVGSLIWGRVYCGWICPINTCMKGVSWIKKKLHIKSFKIPVFFTRTWVRFLVLGLFVALFLFMMITGNKLPVLPGLFIIGIIVTFFFPEELWHRYLCPYGSIMSITASKLKHAIHINSEKCNNCGVCMSVCPGKGIERNQKHHTIIKNNCLVCMECLRKCNQKAIKYI